MPRVVAGQYGNHQSAESITGLGCPQKAVVFAQNFYGTANAAHGTAHNLRQQHSTGYVNADVPCKAVVLTCYLDFKALGGTVEEPPGKDCGQNHDKDAGMKTCSL